MIGAGRIGAGWQWSDLEYTHAGAYRALSDRVELVGFVDTDLERAVRAGEKWGTGIGGTDLSMVLAEAQPDIVSICTQPDDQYAAIIACIKAGVRGIWCEKPYRGPRELMGVPVQVNYMRRGDPLHRSISEKVDGGKVIVYGKDDIHTRCHFEDLAKWWRAALDYRAFQGPCAYLYRTPGVQTDIFFDNGGVNGGECFKAMLGNLLDHIEGKAELWSPASG